MTSLVMCTDAADLRLKAGWDGAHGSSRRRLLVNVQSESTLLVFAENIPPFKFRLYSLFLDDSSTALCHAARPSAATPDFSMHIS